MIAMTIEPLNIREELKALDPPSTRDREIFEQVAVLRRSQEAVSAEYSLTQARVSQIVGRVREWLMTACDDEAGDLPPEMALRLGARMVRLRLERLLSMTMQCFDESKGKVTVGRVRDTGNGKTSEEITRRSLGDLRYLTHYRQVALSLARLDGVETSPHIERPQRSLEEAAAGLRAALAAQERVDEQAERERQLEREQKAAQAAAAKAETAKEAASEANELQAM